MGLVPQQYGGLRFSQWVYLQMIKVFPNSSPVSVPPSFFVSELGNLESNIRLFTEIYQGDHIVIMSPSKKWQMRHANLKNERNKDDGNNRFQFRLGFSFLDLEVSNPIPTGYSPKFTLGIILW